MDRYTNSSWLMPNLERVSNLFLLNGLTNISWFQNLSAADLLCFNITAMAALTSDSGKVKFLAIICYVRTVDLPIYL